MHSRFFHIVLTTTVASMISGASMAYDFTNPYVDPVMYPLVSAVCDTQTWECADEVMSVPEVVDSYADEIYALLKDADPFWRRRMLSYLDNAVIQLYEKEQLYGASSSGFFMQYMRLVLSDIVQSVIYEYGTIRIDQDRFAQLKDAAETKSDLADMLRQEILQGLIHAGFAGFSTDRYVSIPGKLTTSPENRQSWELNTTVIERDILDNYVYGLSRDDNTTEVLLTPDVWNAWEGVFMFKDEDDLRNLDYKVVSHRERINDDYDYRRENIRRAFDHIGYIRVLNPGQTLSYLRDSDFDAYEMQNYLTGKAIFLDEEVDDYGGGLCGGSTAIYQGTFLNTALEHKSRNHSKWYGGLYSASINGQMQYTPGMDSTIYAPYLDLQITNTAPYPMIVVMNYDGTYQGREEVFTMGPSLNDRGKYYHIDSWSRTYDLRRKTGGTRKVQGECYLWNVNGKEETRCYKEVF